MPVSSWDNIPLMHDPGGCFGACHVGKQAHQFNALLKAITVVVSIFFSDTDFTCWTCSSKSVRVSGGKGFVSVLL